MSPLLLSLTLSGAPAVAAQYPYPPAVPQYPYRSGYTPNPYPLGYVRPVPTYSPPPAGFPQPGVYPTPNPYLPTGQNPGPFPPGPPAPAGPVTLRHFAACFVPTPGHHDVWIIHPRTGQPVNVCFDLPNCGHAPKVCLHSHSIEFEYRRQEVEIDFRSNGTVKVEYDD